MIFLSEFNSILGFFKSLINGDFLEALLPFFPSEVYSLITFILIALITLALKRIVF